MNYLRAERTRLGLTQHQVAALCGMSHSSVSLWESGRRRPRAHAGGARLVAIFDRPLEDLLNEDGAAPKDDPADSSSGTAKNLEPCYGS